MNTTATSACHHLMIAETMIKHTLTLHMIVFGLKICVIFTPLRHDLTSGIPDPALQGSTYTCSAHIHVCEVSYDVHMIVIMHAAPQAVIHVLVYPYSLVAGNTCASEASNITTEKVLCVLLTWHMHTATYYSWEWCMQLDADDLPLNMLQMQMPD
jgi:hypothetical protein